MIETYRYQSMRLPGEGLRLGTTRYPPRGVPSERYAKDDYFDERVAVLAPSADLLRMFRRDGGFTPEFERAYRRELADEPQQELISLLAQVHAHVPFVIGCYCADPQQCHQRVLGDVLSEAGPDTPAGRAEVLGEVESFLDLHGRGLGGPSRKALERIRDLLR